MRNALLLKLSLLPLVLMLWLPLIASAAAPQTDGNLEVTFQDEPLFSNLNIAPGFSVSKTVLVRNLGIESEDVYATVSNESSTGLAEVLDLVITSTSTTPNELFSGSFDDFFDQAPISLDALAGGQEHLYTFTVTMSNAVGNAAQGDEMEFNLLIGFDGSAVVVTDTDAGGGGGFVSLTQTTAGDSEVAGESTDGPFFTDLFEQINQKTEESLRAVRSSVLGEATTSAQEIGTTTDADEDQITRTVVDETTLGWCQYTWIFVALWLLVSAIAYWRQNPKDIVTMSSIQIIFGVIALLLLFLSFIYTLSCLFWPAFVVTVGSVIFYLYTRE
jgi:hypothetical protein